VSGGISNSAGGWATVGGGQENVSSGLYATVSGGNQIAASGSAATVPGGEGNTASGAGSFAAGRNAHANHDGSFVWGDGTGGAYSGGPNRFDVLATGGVGFFVPSGNMQIDTAGNVSARSFTPTSDRNAKRDFAPVNSRKILEKVTGLPIQTWVFKDDALVPHIGPMAQDFHAAFGVGPDDKHIATVDADGVALAAIQGLDQKVESENATLRADLKKRGEQIAGLEQRLARLEGLLSAQARQ
jgi:hypothetical protein